jgi:hypothetical protein
MSSVSSFTIRSASKAGGFYKRDVKKKHFTWAAGHKKEPFPEPPVWLDVACSVVLGPDAVRAVYEGYLAALAGFALL